MDWNAQKVNSSEASNLWDDLLQTHQKIQNPTEMARAHLAIFPGSRHRWQLGIESSHLSYQGIFGLHPCMEEEA